MNKKFVLEFQVLFSCVTFWCCVYGIFILFLEIVSLSTLAGVLLSILILSTYLSVWYFALPIPDAKQVLEILGHDLKFVNRRNSLTSPNLATPGDENQEVSSKDTFAVIGHRAAGFDAPENSISGIKQCNEKGCKVVEIDLALTADGVPVLFHDDTIDRITTSSGVVQEMTWDELRTLDISEKHPLRERFVGERIALFKDAVKICVDLNVRMIIDVKDESAKIVQIIVDTFKDNPELYNKAMVSSFSVSLIYMVRSRDPKIVCSLAWRPYLHSCSYYSRETGMVRRYSSLPMHIAACVADTVNTWFLHTAGYFVLGLSAILLQKDAITFEVISEWEKKNIRVVAWTVNRPHEKMYFNRVLQIPYITDTFAGDSLI